MTDDAELIAEMHRNFGTDVLKFVRFYTRDRNEAEDILQEVFLRAYRSLPDFHHECTAKTWLIRIAINVCRNHARWKRRHPILSMDDVTSVHAGMDTEQESLNEIEQWELIRAVGELPIKLKECILLHYFEDQSVAEVAKTLNIGQSAVKQRLVRARKRLERILGGEADGRKNTEEIATNSGTNDIAGRSCVER